VAGDPPVFYAGLAAADADDLVASTVAGKLVERLLYIDPRPASGDGRDEVPFYPARPGALPVIKPSNRPVSTTPWRPALTKAWPAR